MSLASALLSRDLRELPSRRDEDWRWTDLRGFLRALPDPADVLDLVDLVPGPFDALADEVRVLAGGRETTEIDVPPGHSRVVALRVLSRSHSALSARADIRVGEGATLRLLESYEGQGSQNVANVAITLSLAPSATLERVVLAADGPEGILVSDAHVTLAALARFGQTVLTSGGRRQRLETRVDHPGQGAEARLDGAYLLDGQRHADLTTILVHQGPGGVTDQLTKGVVRDQARGVFQGRIVVERGADQTDARMRHKALILSDQAEVDARPELLIHADEVQCAHGSTVGALDDEALFYMRQRGIDQTEARGLLIAAFVGEVADRMDYAPAAEAARAWILRGLAP